MNLQDYINSKSKIKPNADIVERWQTRIVARGLSGASGARQYLSDYGKGIAAPKVIMLAKQATNMGDLNMADTFWRTAFQLEVGHEPDGEGVAAVAVGKVKAAQDENMPEFPESLQPGKFVTMQPVDGEHKREYYINAGRFWGQAKRDGNKVVIFATPGSVRYQSRSLNLRGCPSEEFERTLKAVAAMHVKGSFVLEGEFYYRDVDGGEHRTGAQAATYNVEHERGSTPPHMRFMPFACIFHGDSYLESTYAERVEEAGYLAQLLNQKSVLFEVPITYRSAGEKAALCRLQSEEGREGEIWFDSLLEYTPGKTKFDVFVRTKYMSEFNAIVTALTKTTAQGRLFKAIEVSDMDGKPIGCIGTGFDRPTQQKIVERFTAAAASGGRFEVPVRCQGFTENGMMFLPRLDEKLLLTSGDSYQRSVFADCKADTERPKEVMEINWMLVGGAVMTLFHIIIFIIGAIDGEKKRRGGQ